MQAPASQLDSRVREHFNASTELYVNLHRKLGEVICRERLSLLHQATGKPFDWPLRMLDVGCGGGIFSDMFLETYPRALSFALDASAGMLGVCEKSPRKHMLVADARSVPFGEGRFDLINLDAVLHHVLDVRGYDATINGIVQTLAALRQCLASDGAILIREIYHEYQVSETFGTRLIHFVSTRTLPVPVANLLKKIGLKTANTGVCFLSRRQWDQVFRKAGLRVTAVYDKAWNPSWIRWLGFKASGEMHYVLTSAMVGNSGRGGN
jgi:SAM-dependent methyltransferase